MNLNDKEVIDYDGKTLLNKMFSGNLYPSIHFMDLGILGEWEKRQSYLLRTFIGNKICLFIINVRYFHYSESFKKHKQSKFLESFINYNNKLLLKFSDLKVKLLKKFR